jgi:hypothetical protein
LIAFAELLAIRNLARPAAPYAALQQLCGPMLDRLDDLPTPQRDALRSALGLSAGPAPDGLLIGLAVLTMFSEVAEDRPLVCLVDDLQWLDQASAHAIAFVARRLVAESVGLILATRIPSHDRSTLPTLEIKGLMEADARVLLDTVLTAPLDQEVRDQVVAETRGNPLALLELPCGRTVQEIAGGFGLTTAEQLSAAMEETFRRAVEAPSPMRHDGYCCWRPPSRSAIRPCYGEPPRGWGSVPRRPARPSLGVWLSSQGGCGFAIRSPTRPLIGRLRFASGSKHTARWLRRQIPSWILTGAHGTVLTPRRDPTTMSPPSWSTQRGAHVRVVGSQPRRRFTSGRRC